MNERTPESKATQFPESPRLTYRTGLVQDTLFQFRLCGKCSEILRLQGWVSILPTDMWPFWAPTCRETSYPGQVAISELPEEEAAFALGLALGSPIFPSGCEGKLGVALESLQGRRDLT